MIQDKRINTLVVIVVVFALMTSIALVGLGSRYADGTGNKTKAAYATRIFGTDIISIEIIADEADWQEMLDNAIKEQFIMVDVVVNGTKFQNVGIRPKGNSSLSTVASSNSDRYSFRLQFDEYIKDQTCFGLDGFVINNMLGDNTYMKEYMSYTLMRKSAWTRLTSGLPTSR
jgi:spore coat protein CotH